MGEKSVYELIYQLIQHERKKLWPDVDASDIDETLSSLKDISNMNYDINIDDWVKWFVGNSNFSLKERESAKTMWKIHKVEEISLKKIKDREK